MSIISGSPLEVDESSGFVEICVQGDGTQTAYEVVVSTVDVTAIGKPLYVCPKL